MSIPPGRALGLYLTGLGPVIGGYLAFDKAFAYLHIPGTPLFVGELLLLVGVVGLLTGTGYLRARLRDDPVLLLLAVFAGWGLIRTLPGLSLHGIDAVRDAALWYYAIHAFVVVAAFERSPERLERLVGGLIRLVPWLLAWLPFAVVLASVADRAPSVPWSTVSVLNHKPGNAALAALVALGALWLCPGRPGTRARAWWTIVAVLVIGLVGTQNRGGLLAAVAAAGVGLACVPRQVRGRAVLGAVACLTVTALVLAVVPVPVGGAQGREYSASQLVSNLLSLQSSDVPGNLTGTTRGRIVLWSRVMEHRIESGDLLVGSGFGPNLAVEVGVYDDGTVALRNPHNSHLDIVARMGLFGIVLWISLWCAWYRRMIVGCRVLASRGRDLSRRLSILCVVLATAVGVSSVFDPQLEGAQVAVPLWTAFGIGTVLTRRARPGGAPAPQAGPARPDPVSPGGPGW
ncbi:MAG: O-antigen ligase-like rane protein [Actinomycetota bacterium]|nr:O-antigen ligase-like rane protein [Actinomycetota bacterium]